MSIHLLKMKNKIIQKWNINSGQMPLRAPPHTLVLGPSEYIKKRIQRDKVTPLKLAKAAGMNPSTLHRIINSHGETRRKTLEPLARYWKVDVDEFFKDPKKSSTTLMDVSENPLDALTPEDGDKIREWIIQNFRPEEMEDLGVFCLKEAARAELDKRSKGRS